NGFALVKNVLLELFPTVISAREHALHEGVEVGRGRDDLRVGRAHRQCDNCSDRDRKTPSCRANVHGVFLATTPTGPLTSTSQNQYAVQAFRPASSGGPKGPHYILQRALN